MTDAPVTGVTLTIRLIKSFEYKNVKNMILHDVDLNWSLAHLQGVVLGKIQKEAAYLPFRNNKFDTFKIFYKAHANKPNNLTINLDHDELILDEKKTLLENGVENETEISFFNLAEYRHFQANPVTKW
eukprot:Phypoly_transcript_19867.p1 GENE.Phypoly_transcript_19867~~Phypoly_transcript_19867.p1  ORF type:complete len:128 (+),score=25.70 Phypoly_transcript_19867:168-551(+)